MAKNLWSLNPLAKATLESVIAAIATFSEGRRKMGNTDTSIRTIVSTALISHSAMENSKISTHFELNVWSIAKVKHANTPSAKTRLNKKLKTENAELYLKNDLDLSVALLYEEMEEFDNAINLLRTLDPRKLGAKFLKDKIERLEGRKDLLPGAKGLTR